MSLLGNHRAPVDMVSGEPLYGSRIRLNEVIDEARVLAHDLEGPQGQSFLRAVYHRLVSRIEALMAQDPECQALTGLLTDLQYSIDVATKVAAARVQRHTKMRLHFDQEASGAALSE